MYGAMTDGRYKSPTNCDKDSNGTGDLTAEFFHSRPKLYRDDSYFSEQSYAVLQCQSKTTVKPRFTYSSK